jgi:cytochrome c55X
VRAALLLLAVAAPGVVAQPAAPDAARRAELVRIVRQDCGSCHGLRLTGGLGPALTREALADKPVDAMAATIFHGRPGTPMPPWRALLSPADAAWIARQLALGFPDEGQVRR